MNDFEHRWQQCLSRARQASPREAALAPPGFATRVVARCKAAPGIQLERIWERMAFGSLVALLAVLTLCVALEGPHLRDSHPWNPGLENIVAQVVWRL